MLCRWFISWLDTVIWEADVKVHYLLLLVWCCKLADCCCACVWSQRKSCCLQSQRTGAVLELHAPERHWWGGGSLDTGPPLAARRPASLPLAPAGTPAALWTLRGSWPHWTPSGLAGGSQTQAAPEPLEPLLCCGERFLWPQRSETPTCPHSGFYRSHLYLLTESLENVQYLVTTDQLLNSA